MKGSITRNQTSIANVNGDDADECEWSWQVGMRLRGRYTIFCPGILIEPNWVLSTPSCAGRDQAEVVAGAYKDGSPSDSEQSRLIDLTVRHPEYHSTLKNHDVALFRLESPMTLGKCVSTVCLPRNGDVAVGSTCWMTGWTPLRPQQTGGYQLNLQEAAVEIIPNTECERMHHFWVSDRRMCAKGLTNTDTPQEACQQKTGSPLVCEDAGVWSVHGIFSWGRGCQPRDKTQIWTRVTAELDWIDDTIANPPSPGCPSFATGPDEVGDCRCNSGKCSMNGGRSIKCPTWTIPGARGGIYFRQHCASCRCGF